MAAETPTGSSFHALQEHGDQDPRASQGAGPSPGALKDQDGLEASARQRLGADAKGAGVPSFGSDLHPERRKKLDMRGVQRSCPVAFCQHSPVTGRCSVS